MFKKKKKKLGHINPVHPISTCTYNACLCRLSRTARRLIFFPGAQASSSPIPEYRDLWAYYNCGSELRFRLKLYHIVYTLIYYHLAIGLYYTISYHEKKNHRALINRVDASINIYITPRSPASGIDVYINEKTTIFLWTTVWDKIDL